MGHVSLTKNNLLCPTGCFVLEQNKPGLPLDYIKKLEAVETNGYSGPSILDDITALKPAVKGKACKWYQRKEDEREIP
jgi:hypothetical protein